MADIKLKSNDVQIILSYTDEVDKYMKICSSYTPKSEEEQMMKDLHELALPIGNIAMLTLAQKLTLMLAEEES